MQPVAAVYDRRFSPRSQAPFGYELVRATSLPYDPPLSHPHSFMLSFRLSLACVLAASMLSLTAAAPPPTPDPVQVEFDRFVNLIAGTMMWANGRVTSIAAKTNASDELLIAAAVQQLNQKLGPIKEWHILKKEHVGPAEFSARFRKIHPELYPPGVSGPEIRDTYPSYLIALIDSDQGHKIIAINDYQHPGGSHWARMYNCDAIFSSPQSGGTPLIR
jgi:hypothetical protein